MVKGDEAQKRAGTIGQNVRKLRQDLGWSQSELATKAGVSRGSVANVELGVSKSPDTSTIEALAKALGTTGPALWMEPAETSTPVAVTIPAPSGPADTMPLEAFLQRRADDVTARERRLLEELRNRPGSALTGTEADWLALLDWLRRHYSPRNG